MIPIGTVLWWIRTHAFAWAAKHRRLLLAGWLIAIFSWAIGWFGSILLRR
jgi:hypothetical protein